MKKKYLALVQHKKTGTQSEMVVETDNIFDWQMQGDFLVLKIITTYGRNEMICLEITHVVRYNDNEYFRNVTELGVEWVSADKKVQEIPVLLQTELEEAFNRTKMEVKQRLPEVLVPIDDGSCEIKLFTTPYDFDRSCSKCGNEKIRTTDKNCPGCGRIIKK
jgi:hypothetical protein